jgi:tetratricopeptide (TPR) repeat protein
MRINIKAFFWLGGLIFLALGAAIVWPGCVGQIMTLADSPRSQSYYYFLRAQYEELERRDAEAVASLRRAANLAGDDSYYLKIELAKLLSRSGRIDEAEDFVTKAIETTLTTPKPGCSRPGWPPPLGSGPPPRTITWRP